MKLLYCMLVLLCPCFGHTQPLKIGDTISAASLQHIIYAPAFNPITNPANNKLIILDFMAVNCSSCIEALPRIASLQNQYKDKVQVVLVSKDKRVNAARFLNDHAIGKTLQLPFIVADTTLDRLFPHRYISHLVWIGPDRVVKAFTHSSYLQQPMLEKMLGGTAQRWPVKNDFLSYDPKQALLAVNAANLNEDSYPANIYYSAVTRYLPGIRSGYREVVDSSSNSIKYSIINYGKADMLLKLAGFEKMPKSYVALAVKDKAGYAYDSGSITRQQWLLDNAWCYEQVLPLEMDAAARRQKIIQDLQFYFGIEVKLVKRLQPCLVLKNAPAMQEQKAPPGNSARTISIKAILYEMNKGYTGLPVIDGRDTAVNVYIHKPGGLTIESMRKLLPAYGLVLKEELREIEVLEIRERPYPVAPVVIVK